jgi:hypothetical protein
MRLLFGPQTPQGFRSLFLNGFSLPFILFSNFYRIGDGCFYRLEAGGCQDNTVAHIIHP